MAAPHVAGVAALLKAYAPCLTPEQIKDAILDNVDKVPALNGEAVTGGRLNADKAIRSITTKAVDGRTLTTVKTGDSVDWIEIAQYGNCSLIVRKNFINVYNGHINNPAWQYTPFGATHTYKRSDTTARTRVNDWFNGTALGLRDNLPSNARLRQFTMQNNAADVCGVANQANTPAAFTNAFSKPTNVKMSSGSDVAFLLSYSEAANFVSTGYDVRGANPQTQPSGPIAKSNFAKLTTHGFNNHTHIWMRSPGDNAAPLHTADSITATGRVFQTYYVISD